MSALQVRDDITSYLPDRDKKNRLEQEENIDANKDRFRK